jgi:putative nucleotidyltransferase with HDIG domain
MAPHRSSIFAQKLDRTAFTAYFLGAVVPLLALAYVVQTYVLPTLPDTPLSVGLMAMVGFIAVLSLVSFAILRRTTRQSLQRIDTDNRRLSAMLQISTTLTSSELASDIAGTTAACALELSGAEAAFLMVRGKDGSPELFETEGDDAESLYRDVNAQVTELVTLAMSENRAAIKRASSGDSGSDRGLGATVVMPLVAEGESIGAIVAVHTDLKSDFDNSQVDGLATLAGLSSVAMRNADLRDSQRNFFSHMTDILVSALDAHLDYHSGHGSRVAHNANRVGRVLGFEGKRLEHLHFAALLHDIGMLKFERAARKNPKACEKHTILGMRMLQRIRLWEQLAPIVQSHHEWFDGTGYPQGLVGEAIPLEARIISVCDAHDAMTSSTSYQIALPLEAACDEIRRGSGTQFDPTIVAAFLQLAERGELDESS